MKMTSRQRMLAALACQEPDRPPCSFMLYNGLKATCQTYMEFIQRQMDLGLDAYVQLPPRPPVVVNDYYNLHGLPVSYHPEVTIREWMERIEEERWPVLYKEYSTPAGVLLAEVYQDPEWRWGNHVPFLDDFIINRSRKFLVTREADLDALGYLLVPPSEAEIAEFKEQSQPVLDFAKQNDLLVTGGWGVGADLVGWVYGLENMIYASHDQPQFMEQLLGIIAAWNRRRMEVVLQAGIDLFIKRAWYENSDFWSPKTWRKFLFPILKEDVELAHSRGAKFGYLMTSSVMPLLGGIAEAGVDVLIGVDPAKWDLAVTKRKLAGKVCLWGGVNGHLTVERGSIGQVQAEVRTAMQKLAPGGGFILSPVDNVREDSPKIRRNVQAFIEEWQAQAS